MAGVFAAPRIANYRLDNSLLPCPVEWQTVVQGLRTIAPDILLLFELPNDVQQAIAAFRKATPWGYVVMLSKQCGSFEEALEDVDEVWSPLDESVVRTRLSILQGIAELNRSWQALPQEVAVQAAISKRLTLLTDGRIASPRSAVRLLMSQTELMLAATTELQVLESAVRHLPLRIMGVEFPWAVPAHKREMAVAECLLEYAAGRSLRQPRPMQELVDHCRQLANRVGLEYELQVERIRTVVLRQERAQLAVQVSHQCKLAAAGELAAGIAHEIRNPLAAVRGFIQLLQQRLLKAEMNTELKYTEYILDEIDRANHILNDFLAATKPIDEPKRAIGLAQLLTDLVQLVQHQAILDDVELSLEVLGESPRIWARAAALQQVFLNLLSNALQATPSGGKIAITMHPGLQCVRVEIADTGVGIPPEEASRIFEPFYTTKPSGTGLGLAICREIIIEHGGSITVQSTVGRGSVFSVTLPLTKTIEISKPQ